MDEKTRSALTALAQKLGTTAEYLWGVLLKQAPIAGVTDLIVMAAWIAAIVFWARVVSRKTATPPATALDEYPAAQWRDEVGVGFAWLSVVALAVLAALVIGCGLSTTVAAFFNPEYWALKQILK